jgi:2-keto-4-pentenoate hydratase/2-oxohepta-3-ene-1,7-dioic acid hydratase in catechol pathway
MRIVRFRAEDDRVYLGDDRGDGTATRLLDPLGVLGPFTRTAPHERLRGRHALVADDDEGMRTLMATTLVRAGCSCTVCADGAEAVHALEKEPIDLVVSDIAMPHHDGYAIFTAARERRADTAVVLVTGFGYDPNHTIVKATADGCDAILYKPFTAPQLLDEIDRAIRASTVSPTASLVPMGEPVPIGTRLAPLIPIDVICVGRNFPDGNAAARAEATAEEMEVFLKPSTAVQDPGGSIRIPAVEGTDPRLACEGELAVVIGRDVQGVEAADVMSCVVGFTAANDVTARRWQTPQGAPRWMRGKGFATFCPIGPAIVTPDDLPPIETLSVRTLINGDERRRGRVGDMLHPVPQILAALARHVALRAGTVVLTGAPPLLPGASDELEPGDEVVVEIDGIPPLANRVERGDPAPS